MYFSYILNTYGASVWSLYLPPRRIAGSPHYPAQVSAAMPPGRCLSSIPGGWAEIAAVVEDLGGAGGREGSAAHRGGVLPLLPL